jgi:Permuted papain-like amidase enzyme, YaeF/YiiX, C92 family
LFFQELGEHPAADDLAECAGWAGRVVDHVALFAPDGDGAAGVIEAYPPRVRWTGLPVFLTRHLDGHGHPAVFVGRLRPPLQRLIPAAIDFARSRIGRPFDEWYEEGDDAYYCSELICCAFREANSGREVFPSTEMRFGGGQGDTVSRYWRRHFSRAGRTIPNGLIGSNPGLLSRFDQLHIVAVFGDAPVRAHPPRS